MPVDPLPRGYTPRELARILRIGRDRLVGMIRRGELGAIDTAPARCGRPRYVILPHHLAAWERSRAAAEMPAPARRRRRTAVVDFYPDE
jgi:hypothetical protein